MTFDNAVLKQRRARFLEKLAGGVAVISAAHEITRSNDSEYPFRQDSDFWYLTGFPEPDAIAILRPGHVKPYVLFVRPKDREREIWTGFRAGPEGAMATYGADEAYPLDEFAQRLPELIPAREPVYLRLGKDAKLDARILEVIETRRGGRAGVEAPAGILDPTAILAEMRLFKTADELPWLEKAAQITGAGHIAAMRETRPGMFEYEVQARVEYEFRRRGAAAPGYGSIVAGGANATVLHYVENAQPLKDGQLLLIDAGAEVAGYTGDVTRTFPVGKRFEGAARELYEVVLAAQLRAIEATKPGATIDEIHEETCRVLLEGLVALGVLQGSIDSLWEKKAYRPYYMHRTSHWLGLDVHDVGAYLRDGRPRPLEPGMVLTIEPGLYFHADTPAPERFHGLGIRIEDDILITLKGNRNLTAEVPKTIADIEALRQS